MRDIADRLRAWCHDINAVPASDIMDEAASEIERLRHRLRFTDNVIRSGDVATLTDAERGAVADAADRYAEIAPESAETAATLRGLLERLATTQVVAKTATSCGLTDAEREAVTTGSQRKTAANP